MENKIETVVEETEAMGVATHAGLKKGAIIIAVAGIVGAVGFVATRFVIKPIIKKIKAKKDSKKAAVPVTQTNSFFEDDDIDDVPMLFDEEDEG